MYAYHAIIQVTTLALYMYDVHAMYAMRMLFACIVTYSNVAMWQ